MANASKWFVNFSANRTILCDRLLFNGTMTIFVTFSFTLFIVGSGCESRVPADKHKHFAVRKICFYSDGIRNAHLWYGLEGTEEQYVCRCKQTSQKITVPCCIHHYTINIAALQSTFKKFTKSKITTYCLWATFRLWKKYAFLIPDPIRIANICHAVRIYVDLCICLSGFIVQNLIKSQLRLAMASPLYNTSINANINCSNWTQNKPADWHIRPTAIYGRIKNMIINWIVVRKTDY